MIGLRRYHACRELELERIPCYIALHFDEERVATAALEENVHRKDLTQPELLEVMLRLRAKGYTVERIAERSRLSAASVSVYLRIPEFPEPVRKAFFDGEISFEHVRALMGLGRGQMLGMLRRIRSEGLSSGDVGCWSPFGGTKRSSPISSIAESSSRGWAGTLNSSGGSGA